MKTSICLLTYNRLGIVARCFRSLALTLQNPDVEWRILDNASTDGTAQWLLKMAPQHKNVHVTLSAQNLGVAGGRALLFDQAQGDIIVSLDSDVEARNPQWLELLTKPLENIRVGIAGQGGHFITSDWGLEAAPPNEPKEVDVLSGYCQAFRRKLITQYGVRLDAGYNYGGAEDDDFCAQIAALRLKVWHTGNVGLHHIYSGTWNLGGKSLYPQMRRRLYDKWKDRNVFKFQESVA